MSTVALSPQRLAAFWERVDKGEGCWLWTGATNGQGRGVVKINRRREYVYRVAWELERGPIPEGFEIDHTCFTPLCLRVDHLRLLTRSENATMQPRYFQTHCKRGHEFTDANTIWQNHPDRRPSRQCRECSRLHQAARTERRRQERAA